MPGWTLIAAKSFMFELVLVVTCCSNTNELQHRRYPIERRAQRYQVCPPDLSTSRALRRQRVSATTPTWCFLAPPVICTYICRLQYRAKFHDDSFLRFACGFSAILLACNSARSCTQVHQRAHQGGCPTRWQPTATTTLWTAVRQNVLKAGRKVKC